VIRGVGGTLTPTEERREVFRARRIMRRRAPEAHDERPPPEAAPDAAEQIKELHELREQGILTEEEFTAEKKKLLGL
jgi:putative oligomerization/nucleic acid binding protein